MAELTTPKPRETPPPVSSPEPPSSLSQKKSITADRLAQFLRRIATAVELGKCPQAEIRFTWVAAEKHGGKIRRRFQLDTCRVLMFGKGRKRSGSGKG